MGKCCIRFKKIEDLPLDVIGRLIARVGVKTYIAGWESLLKSRGAKRRKA